MPRTPKLLLGHDAQVAQWVLERIPHVTDFGACTAIGIGSEQTGTLYAGVVYNDYQPLYGTIQASIASVSPLWATPGTIKALLHYPFEQIGVELLWAVTRSDNAKARNFLSKIEFKQEAILRHRFGKGVHAVSYSMTATEYRRHYGGE